MAELIDLCEGSSSDSIMYCNFRLVVGVGSWKLEASLKKLFCSVVLFSISGFFVCVLSSFSKSQRLDGFQFPYRTVCWIYRPFVYDTVYFYFITVLPFIHSTRAKKE